MGKAKTNTEHESLVQAETGIDFVQILNDTQPQVRSILHTNYTKITQLCDKTSQASSNPFAIFLKS